jgi:hypothetical protein
MKNSVFERHNYWIMTEDEKFLAVLSNDKTAICLYDANDKLHYPGLRSKGQVTTLKEIASKLQVFNQMLNSPTCSIKRIDYDGYFTGDAVPDIKKFKIVRVDRKVTLSEMSKSKISQLVRMQEKKELTERKNIINNNILPLLDAKNLTSQQLKSIEKILQTS